MDLGKLPAGHLLLINVLSQGQHTWNPPLIKGRERLGPPKIESLDGGGGVPKILLKMGDNPEKGGLM